MTIFLDLVQDDDAVRDVEIMVREASGVEWLFRVSLIKETKEIVEPRGARRAQDIYDDFGDELEDAPRHVWAEFQASREKAIHSFGRRGDAVARALPCVARRA